MKLVHLRHPVSLQYSDHKPVSWVWYKRYLCHILLFNKYKGHGGHSVLSPLTNSNELTNDLFLQYSCLGELILITSLMKHNIIYIPLLCMVYCLDMELVAFGFVFVVLCFQLQWATGIVITLWRNEQLVETHFPSFCHWSIPIPKIWSPWVVASTTLRSVFIDVLRPGQNGRYFPDDIFKHIFKWNILISIKISLKFIPKGPISNFPALVQRKAWRRPGDKPFSEPMKIMLIKNICHSLSMT